MISVPACRVALLRRPFHVLRHAPVAVLRPEHSREIASFDAAEDVDGAEEIARHSRLVAQQADALAAHRRAVATR